MTTESERSSKKVPQLFLLMCALVVAGFVLWQAVVAAGAPDPFAPGTSSPAATLDIAVLVFREGLECVLVLATITAGIAPQAASVRRPIALGVTAGLVATLATWAAAIGILNDLSHSVSALALQAATGLLAVVVLLVVMNWFFHKVYWTGWISFHNIRKRSLLERMKEPEASRPSLFWGMVLLGFTALYREGFEVVLFLQSYRLKLGNRVVLEGGCIGLLLSGIVAVLTFVAHRRLPYRRMLILTGILLGGVLIVMVGEQVQEMQLAHWVPATTIPWLADVIPPWMGVWFSVFPTIETLVGQALAAILVLGSYVAANRPPAKSDAGSESFPVNGPLAVIDTINSPALGEVVGAVPPRH